MKYDKDNLIKQYDNACDMCKHGWQAGLWPSWGVQHRVFKEMLNFGPAGTGYTLLDVGCGQGDMMGHIIDYCLDFKYTGIDISPKMIEKAKEKYPNDNFYLQDVMDHDGSYDYVVATGTFNFAVSTSDEAQMEYTRIHLEKLYSLCKRGIAAFFLSKLLWESYYDGLYYHDPILLIKECAGISKLFTVDHCTMPGLVVVRLFKNVSSF